MNMANHTWRFFRAGGFDQVSIETGADLLSLKELDQKLWVALSCPLKDLQFDEKTVKYIDSDNDGHIRALEIIEAATWAGSLLKDPELLVLGDKGVPLSAIMDTTEEGRLILSSAKHILKNVGKETAEVISVKDTEGAEALFAQMRFNGDGIIQAEVTDDPSLRSVITDIIKCLGAENDRSGFPGITQEKAERFFAEARSYLAWRSDMENDTVLRLFEGHLREDFQGLSAVRDKVNDYFTRCSLAGLDERSVSALNPSEAEYQKLALVNLSQSPETLASFPLARIEPQKPLPLVEGINPAWAGLMGQFREQLINPVLGEKNSLTEEEWREVLARLALYDKWLNLKPENSVEHLGVERLREIVIGGYDHLINELISQDRALESEVKAVSSVDKLVRYCKYLPTMVNNFVAFKDFYGGRSKAIFQAGTLFLDGRSFELCVKVDDINAHAALANLSRLFLIYCNCTRRGGEGKMTIAAAVTAGDSDQLMVGRNGVFYDRNGQDWDATIARIVEHPINLRQAFWAPYKQASRLISEQITKIAAARSKANEQKMVIAAMQTGKKGAAGEPPAEKSFDVGKFAGIFAAIGLAIGAIGTAVASILSGLLNLAWWKLPLVFLGLLLVVSGPSLFIAFFKLRQRNLGPILDANGWAVNTRAKINIKFGSSLTALAKLPEGSEKPVIDPFADKKSPWSWYLFGAVLLGVVLLLWRFGYWGKWLEWVK